MDIGIGLPSVVPPPHGHGLADWARRAERLGFSTLGVIDRVVYGNYEPLVALAAAGAVTSTVRLAATVLLPGYRNNTALLAKQLSTIDHMSGGRLTVGLAAGARPDDFVVSGAEFRDRGRRLDAMVPELREYLAGRRAVGPWLPSAPPLLVGGQSPVALDRAARCADGWVAGGSSGSAFTDLVEALYAGWARYGRPGKPRIVALAYVALGPQARERAEQYVSDYYAFAGPYAGKVAASVVTDPVAVRRRIAERRDAGCDELLFMPCDNAPDQVERLAEAALDVHGGPTGPPPPVRTGASSR